MKRSRLFLSGLLLSCLLLSGCFNSADINDLALVMAVGLDKGEEPGTVTVTAQVARPADVVGQTGAPSAGTDGPIWTASATGHSIFEAMRNLSRYSSRRVYWAHNKVIVISEDLAKTDGINDIIDFFTRNHELRMRTWVVVTPEKASEIVATKTGLEVVPGTSVERLFQYSRLVAEAPKVDMRTLQANYLSSGAEVVLPIVQTKPRGISQSEDATGFKSTPQVELSGTAYFEGDKLKGVLSPKQSRALMWFLSPPESRVIVLPCPNDGRSNASLEMTSHHFQVIPAYENGRVGFHVLLKADFDMVELGCRTRQNQKVIMTGLEREVQDRLAAEIKDIIHVSQANRADFLGLGEKFQDKYPLEWLALEPKWADALSSARVSVTSKVRIHSPVLLQTPTAPGTMEDAQR